MMELYEVVEVCPHCGCENVFSWNTDLWGYVAHCKACGSEMMLCDECMHPYDKETDSYPFVDNCDWCKDCDGVCHKNTSPVVLSTYGSYDEDTDDQQIFNFEVPKNWLWKYVKENGYETIDEFLDTYTWDTTMDTYARALEDKVIINEWEV
jgi:hypothetical protein